MQAKLFGRINLALLVSVSAGALWVSTAQAYLTHRYSFNDGTPDDSVGGANGTLMGSTGGGPTVSGGQLNLNNPGFQPASPTNNYLSLPTSILPTSGSATIEEWFTFQGSGFYTESWAFSDCAGGANPPGATNGEYLIHTISNPQSGPVPSGGGSSIAQSLAGYSGGESRAYGTTPGIGAGGGGYLDDGETFFAATVIDANAGTLSYYLYDVTAGGVGGLQDTIAAIPLSSYNFNTAYLGKSPFDGDNATSGTIDEFRIYNSALTPSQIAEDYALGPNLVRFPGSFAPVSLSVTASGGNLIFSWPSSSALDTLESSPTLGPGATWTPVLISNGGEMTVSGSDYQLSLPMSQFQSAQFFRLSE